jgi:hypothetical protein
MAHQSHRPPFINAFITAFQPQFRLTECSTKNLNLAARLIGNNICLERIVIRASLVRDRTPLAAIGPALKTNTHLRVLNLGGHQMGKIEVEEFQSVLQSTNFTLEKIYSHVPRHGNSIKKQHDDLQFFLKLNRYDRKLLLHPGSHATQRDWNNTIIRAKDELDVVFYYLSKNPSVLLRARFPTYKTRSSCRGWEQANKRAKLA